MCLIPLLCVALSPIQIDGSFHDWPSGISSQEDTHFLYKRIELPTKGCLQQLPKQMVVELGEYTIFFSPKGKGYGVSCKKGDDWISPYEAGIVFSPTTASTEFEVRVNKPNVHSVTTPFSLEPKGEFRVVSWNVQFGNMLEDKERSARILKALKPDVLLLQELDGDDTPALLSQFLSETLGKTWNVAATPVHGTKQHHRLRSAIATPNETEFVVDMGTLKAMYGVVTIKKKPIHCFSLHLRCCGGPTGEAEEQRQKEATAIRTIIDTFHAPRCIIAGDWNLVGTATPLEIVQEGKLAIVDAYQPDGKLNATWSDATSSFTPGRLDWMLYSPSAFSVVNSYVLDTADLGSETLIANDLLPEDTAELSDHLPLVADFKIIK